MSENKFYHVINRCKQNLIVIAFIFFVYILSFYFRDKINLLIFKHLTVNKTWSNLIIDVTLLFVSLGVLLFFSVKTLKNRYLYSYHQFSILIAALCFLILFSLIDTEWEYTKFFYGLKICFPHICVPFIILSVLLILGIWNYIIPEKSKSTLFIFKEDNALDSSLRETDILNYTHIVKNLKEKLAVQYFNKSFTVGIIGPWGNGKSSFINLLKEEFKDEKETILVNFLPYLNHTEAEISSEFFHSFQSALQPHSGKLSNLILEYSNKLLNLYNSQKGLNNFLKADISSFNTTSANDTYELINDVLGKINKKIIVFVDDLDRLNHEEILQVLKLIRNTANFKNTIFVVAMDKGYILNQLNSKEVILNNRFIDKFFQLEIYLPEIDNAILIEEFKNILSTSLIFNEQINIELNNILNENKILFYDYIKNLRDVKRVCNQIIFEYEFINEEIKLEDFINFIFLKLTFPEFINKLKSNPLQYLDKFDNYYRLIKLSPDNVDSEGIFNIYSDNINELEYKKYKIYGNFFNEDETCKDEILNLSCDQKKLLVKTLIWLFGSVNDTTHNSIKFENNFRRFIQLSYKNSDFLNKNFMELIQKTDIEKIKTDIELIISNNQETELLDRLKFFDVNDNDIEKIKTITVIYVCLLETVENNKLTEFEVLRNLRTLYHLRISENSNFKIISEISEWLLSEIIETEKFTNETQLKLIGHLWGLNDSGNLWEIERIKLEEVLLQKFEAYLGLFNQNLWSVNDYKFYRIYHDIKIIGDLRNKLIEAFKSFLSNNEIYTYCVQSTDFDSFEDNVYKITDTVVEFFDSKENYYNFIKKHKDSSKPEVVEYLKFLKLFIITKFSISILYEFNESQLFNLKRDHLKFVNGGSLISDKRESKLIQIFLEIKSINIFNTLKKVNQFDNSIYRLSDLKFFIYNDNFYIVITNYYGKDKKHIDGYMMKIYEHLKDNQYRNLTVKGLEFKYNNDIIIEKYSLQPNIGV